MIQNIGLSRIIVITILVALNLVFGGLAYFYIMPENVEQEKALRNAKSTTQARYNEIVELRQDFATLKDRIKGYSLLELSGFFDNQNKVFAETKLNELAVEAGLQGNLNVGSATLIEDDRAAKAGHVILRSPVDLKLTAADDTDVFYFLKLMESHFPGMLEYKEMSLKRTKNLDSAALKQIGNDIPTALVEANIVLDWVTMPDKGELN